MRAVLVLAALLAVGVAATTAEGSAPPVGPVTHPTVTSVAAAKGSLVAVALPRRTGFDWRIARTLDPSVVREVSEGEVGSSVVLVFRAVGKGRASILVAQTRGERPRAYRAVRYDVRVG
jgi:hypothetical protein